MDSSLTKIKNKQLLINSDFDINNQRLINVDTPFDDKDAVNKIFVDTLSINSALGTGLYSGGTIRIINNDHFSIDSGIGNFVNPISKEIIKLSWGNITNILVMTFGLTDITISIGIDINGDVIQQILPFTSEQRNNYIVLGELFIHPINRTLSNISFQPVLSRDLPSIVDIYFNESPKNIEGNNIITSGNTLHVNVTSGKVIGYSINSINSLSYPNAILTSNISNISFFSSNYNGTEWIYGSLTNTISPNYWSNGTPTLQNSTSSKYNLRIIMRSVTMSLFFLLYPTQTREYNDIIDAESNLYSSGLTIPDELYSHSIPLCYIIIKGDATDLSDINQCKIIPIESISSSSTSVSSFANNIIYDSTNAINLNDSNVQSALTTINNKIEALNYSDSNLNMIANNGIGIYKATDIPVIDVPKTIILVEVNGIPVVVGNGQKTNDCFFSTDLGVTAKNYNDVQQGDFLYWNNSTATYKLEADDLINFIYMVM